MKKLIDIIEGLKIGSKTKISRYDPDVLNGDEWVLYDDTAYDEEDEDDKDVDWQDCESQLETINNNYDRFLVTKFNPLSKIKDFEKSIYDINLDLLDLKDKIITGNDYGYAIKLSYGHIEIHCINSGSRGIYYIYSLSPKAYENMQTWWETPDELEGNTDEEKLAFLFDEGSVIEIKEK